MFWDLIKLCVTSGGNGHGSHYYEEEISCAVRSTSCWKFR